MTQLESGGGQIAVSQLLLKELKSVPQGELVVRPVPDWVTEGGPKCEVLTWPGVIRDSIHAINELIDQGRYADLPDVRVSKYIEGATIYSPGRTKRTHSTSGSRPPIAYGAEDERPNSYLRIQPVGGGPWLTDGFVNAFQTAVPRFKQLRESIQDNTYTVPGFGLVNSLNLPNQREIWSPENRWFARIMLYSAAETIRYGRQEAECLFIDKQNGQETRRWEAMDRVIGGLNWGKKAGASIPDWAHMQFFLFSQEFCMRYWEAFQMVDEVCTRCIGFNDKISGSEVERVISPKNPASYRDNPIFVYAPYNTPPNTKEGRVTRVTTMTHYRDILDVFENDPKAALQAADELWNMMDRAHRLAPEETCFNLAIAGSPRPAHWFMEMYEGESQGVNSMIVPTLPKGQGRVVPSMVSYVDPVTTAAQHRSTSASSEA